MKMFFYNLGIIEILLARVSTSTIMSYQKKIEVSLVKLPFTEWVGAGWGGGGRGAGGGLMCGIVAMTSTWHKNIVKVKYAKKTNEYIKIPIAILRYYI